MREQNLMKHNKFYYLWYEKSVRFQILLIVSLKLNSKYSFGVKCNVKDHFSASVQAAVQNSHEPTISSSLLLVTTANKHQRSSEGVERNRTSYWNESQLK